MPRPFQVKKRTLSVSQKLQHRIWMQCLCDFIFRSRLVSLQCYFVIAVFWKVGYCGGPNPWQGWEGISLDAWHPEKPAAGLRAHCVSSLAQQWWHSVLFAEGDSAFTSSTGSGDGVTCVTTTNLAKGSHWWRPSLNQGYSSSTTIWDPGGTAKGIEGGHHLLTGGLIYHQVGCVSSSPSSLFQWLPPSSQKL